MSITRNFCTRSKKKEEIEYNYRKSFTFTQVEVDNDIVWLSICEQMWWSWQELENTPYYVIQKLSIKNKIDKEQQWKSFKKK